MFALGRIKFRLRTLHLQLLFSLLLADGQTEFTRFDVQLLLLSFLGAPQATPQHKQRDPGANERTKNEPQYVIQIHRIICSRRVPRDRNVFFAGGFCNLY